MGRFIALIAAFLSSSSLCAQQINTEAAEKFWKVLDTLQADRPISESLWQEFKSAFAHQNWLERHNNGWNKNYEPGYKKALEIVFRPSLVKERDSILRISEPTVFLPESDDWNYVNMHVRSIYEGYHGKDQKIKSFYKKYLNEDYADTIYHLALEMLPSDFERPTRKLDTLTIYVQGISNTASTGAYGIMFSLPILYKREKDNIGTLGAHELHHALRLIKLKEEFKEKDRYAVAATHMALNEGSADLLGQDYEGFDEWKDNFTQDSDSIIRVLDDWFRMTYTQGTHKATDDVNSLFKYSSGHNPGFYMADIIDRNGLRSELKENVYNPFHFFRLYQQAASVDSQNPPTFSKESLRYINELERLYFIE